MTINVSLSLVNAKEKLGSPTTSFKTMVDVPLGLDRNLVGTGGGLAIVRHWANLTRPYTFGLRGEYHYAPLSNNHLGDLGSLSVLSSEFSSKYWLNVGKHINLNFRGGGGLFYAMENGDISSNVQGLAFGGSIGLGLKTSPTRTIVFDMGYKRFNHLYHLLNIGICLEFR